MFVHADHRYICARLYVLSNLISKIIITYTQKFVVYSNNTSQVLTFTFTFIHKHSKAPKKIPREILWKMRRETRGTWTWNYFIQLYDIAHQCFQIKCQTLCTSCSNTSIIFIILWPNQQINDTIYGRQWK